MATTWGEMFPPSPSFTEKDIPSQDGRVFLVTGGSTGVGYELAKALFHLNGRVYIASRSERTARAAIAAIRASSPHPSQVVRGGKGELVYLRLDLGDLSGIKASAMEFLAKEKRLDVVWHNAGIMVPANDLPTPQGHHVQLGVNALGPFLLQHFLTPLCVATSVLPSTSRGTTRVIFVSSSGHRAAPGPDGINWADLNLPDATGLRGHSLRYGQSKAMNVMHAHELARQFGPSSSANDGAQGLVALSLHPGALSTGLQANMPSWFNMMFKVLRHEPRLGALTELFAGLGPMTKEQLAMLEVEGGRNGSYILPWGRWGAASPSVVEGLKSRGTGERLWKVCEEMLREWM